MNLTTIWKHAPLLLLCGFLGYLLAQFWRHWKTANHHNTQQLNGISYNSRKRFLSKAYSFQRSMCEERKYIMNWEEMLAPCKEHFTDNKLPRTLATQASTSRIVSRLIRPVGDYSTITIQTYDKTGRAKTIGGDEWRALVRGPSVIEPMVRDLANGKYEASFLLLEAGTYKVDFYLHDTLCDSFMDPPADWVKKGGGFLFLECQYKV